MNSDCGELWSICDVMEDLLKAKGEEFGIPELRRFSDHQKMLADPELDAVIICTPNFNHFQIAKDAIESRKPFALEKPVALDSGEAAVLRDMLKADPLPHMICFSYRYIPAVRYARYLIKQRKLGKIRHIYSQYLQSWAIGEDFPLVWRFRKQLTGSGALGDLGSHMLDLTRFLVGDTSRVFSQTGTIIKERNLPGGTGKGVVDVDDYCHILGELDDGISYSMSISRFAYGRGNYQRMELYGSEGALIYRLEDTDSLYVRFAAEEDQDFRKVDIPEAFRVSQIQAFCNLINGKGDGLDASMEDGYVNQLAIDAIIAAAESGRWVAIDL
ncbi:MAG TPA: Gfo/Idh/MocA family oxidoreductase, partial [Bacilli bacterium]